MKTFKNPSTAQCCLLSFKAMWEVSGRKTMRERSLAVGAPWSRPNRRMVLSVTALLFGLSLCTSLSYGSQRDGCRSTCRNRHGDPTSGACFHISHHDWRCRGRSLFQSTEIMESGGTESDRIRDEAETTKRKVFVLLRQNEFGRALHEMEDMISNVKQASASSTGEEQKARKDISSLLDQTFQAYTNVAFSAPYRGAQSRARIKHGLGAVQLQLSSSGALLPPYNTCPRATLVLALKAISGVIGAGLGHDSFARTSKETEVADSAFRILQRLMTGMGVRQSSSKPNSLVLSERDLNMVLNAVCNAGRMDIALKIIGLQERAPITPPLSPVSYSILLKGYGRQRDIHSVERTLSHAQTNGIKPDTIMLNSAIDAYINCGNADKARDVFDYMVNDSFVSDRLTRLGSLFTPDSHPSPNRRTYNTMLKGLAKQADIESALEIADRMRELKLWDDITTNTLVSAAVSAQHFDLAESILANHTVAVSWKKGRQAKKHPNVEAYTELLDAYAKSSQLDKAMGTLQLMHQRGVEPNEFTYTCAVGALARAKKVDQATKLLEFFESRSVRPNAVVFNSLITGLVAQTEPLSVDQQRSQTAETFDAYVNEAIVVFRSMMKKGVRPNSITISVLVDAFGRCEPPRIDEAKALVGKLETDRIIVRDNNMIATSLVRICGVVRDLKGAVESFGKMKTPDTAAVNALMEACCQCEHENLAFDTFDRFFGKESSGKIRPDVISYSVLIKALLKRNLPRSMEQTRGLYNDMKNVRNILPDKALVDMILRAIVRSRRTGLQKRDVEFALSVVRDAKGLDWGAGEFEKRKQAVRAVMVGRVSEIWKDDESWYGTRADDNKDPLFARYGWNKVDSGFSVWGHASERNAGASRNSDEFLREDWNDVDSGFRII